MVIHTFSTSLPLFFKKINHFFVLIMGIETTIQTLYFHEETSIYSICTTGRHLYTAGGDAKIRAWHIHKEERAGNEDFSVKNPVNSLVKITYCSTLEGHKKTVNCVRNISINGEQYLISCDDSGKILFWVLNGCEYECHKIFSTDSCQEIIYAEKDGNNYIICGLNTGKLILLDLILNHKVPKAKLLQTIKAHTMPIEGLAYNMKYNIISTMSKDASCKLYQIQKKKLALYETIEKITEKYSFADEHEIILTRRHSFSQCGKFMYLTTCKNVSKPVSTTLRYPFHDDCIYGKNEGLDGFVSKVIDVEEFGPIFFTGYNCYIPEKDIIIKDCVLQPVIDACYRGNIIFIASVDGFIATIRFD